jgi:acyl carrier protein
MHTQIESQVLGLLKKTLNYEVTPKDYDTPRADFQSWDSLVHMEIIFSCEDLFGIEFSPEDLETLNSTGALIKCILGKLN